MNRIRGLTVLLASALAPLHAATAVTSEPMAWRFAHPEAQILAGVDFRKLAETPDGKQIRDQFTAALGAPLLEQAEHLLLSSVVDASGQRSDVLILSGSFSLARLRQMATREGARMLPYKGLEIAAPAGATAADPHVAWMTGRGGGTTVLIGTRPAIQAAAERSKANVESLASVNPLFARAAEMAPRYAVWVSCDTVPRGFGPKTLDRLLDGEADGAGRVEGLDVAVQVGSTTDLRLWVWTSSEAAADSVLKQLQASANAKESFTLASWLPDLKGGLDDSTLVLGATLAAGTGAGRIGPLLATFALPVDVKAPAAPAVAIRAKLDANVPMTGAEKVVAAAPAAPKKMFVRIEGLEDGSQAIPYAAKP